MAAFDRVGRYVKEYQARLDPNRWREEQYIAKYRLGSKRVRWLAGRYGESGCSRTKGTSIGGGLSYEKQMTLALRYLATGATFDTVGESQQVSTATVSRCVEDVTAYFYKDANRFIRWPHTLPDKVEVAQGFYERHKQKPHVLGCVDGTHIQIISPSKESEAVFINRKSFYSLNAMVVCDAYNRITHIDPSWAGSAADSYIFNSSPLKEDADSGRWGEFFLLGDSGYGVSNHVLTPFLHPANDTEKMYNKWHRSTGWSLVHRLHWLHY